jgi:hypothetical protein
MRKIHLTNAGGRDATVSMEGLRTPTGTRPGLPDRAVTFTRYLACTETGLHDRLAAAHGADYADALIAGDPEVDIEQVGRRIEGTDRIYLSSTGDVLYAAPRVVEVIIGPDGQEKQRRAPEDIEANTNAEDKPIRWTGRKMPRRDVVRRVVFRRTVQIRHVDGVTYDYLYEMARSLAEDDALMMLGAGDRGREPLVFQTNGSPYRGFLEGRVDGERYKLLLHLSNMELKRPDAAEADK